MKIGFIRKLVLKLITKLQGVAVQNDNRDIYMFLTKLHFKLYFRKSLVDAALENSEEFKKAARRHGRIVMTKVHKRTKKTEQNMKLYKLAQNSFKKDLLLEVEL